MILAASNIAWDFPNRLACYAVLRDEGFAGLEIAPGLLFPEAADPLVPDEATLRLRADEIADHGLRPVSMQSLLFGVAGAALFGSPTEVQVLSDAMRRAIDLAARLGVPNLVFGSPRQRVVPEGLGHDAVMARVRDVVLPLAERAAVAGTRIALEPNASDYGTNFMTDIPETLIVVEAVAHPAVTLNFDLGTLALTSGMATLEDMLRLCGRHVSHVHVSRPFLAAAPQSAEEAGDVIGALQRAGYERSVSIEMKADAGDPVGALALAARRLREGAGSAGLSR